MSSGGAAQRFVEVETGQSAASALKLAALERLAAHRARRADVAGPSLFEHMGQVPNRPHDSRAARIAAAVADRYAHTQSYRAFLAAEAQRAHEKAQRTAAAAEVALRTAEAVAAVQLQLIEELRAFEEEHTGVADEPVVRVFAPAVIPPLQSRKALTVRLYEVPAPSNLNFTVANGVPLAVLHDEERLALEEEIAFRQAPVFEDFREASVPLPANLIEFPRQLVAARKARPRFAEGPLREEEERGGVEAQLRIFEVEPELISIVAAPESCVPEWSSIRLSACTVSEPVVAPECPVSYPHRPITASVSLRLMATLVDGCILLGALLGFATGVVYLGGSVPAGQVAAISVGGAFVVLVILYFLLFFSLAEATPGMRYARVGFCTMDDENPTRQAVRRRLIAMLLAACPMGLGFLWAFVDEEGLGWHDRMSGMYPRSY